MKTTLSILAVIVAISATAFAQKEGENVSRVGMASLHDSLGYMTGWNFGLQVKREEIDKPVLNYSMLVAGAQSALLFTEPAIPIATVDNLLAGVRQKLERIYSEQDTTVNVPLEIYGKPSKNKPGKIKVHNDSISYAIGYNFGYSIRNTPQIAPLTVAQGVADCLNGKKPALTEDDFLALEIRKQQMKALRQEEVAQDMNRQKQLLEDNANRPEVQLLPGGIQYEVLDQGKGDRPAVEDQVTVHLVARKLLENKTFFDTYQTDQPLIYDLSSISEDWITILTQMPVGSKWKLWIPPDNNPDSQSGALGSPGPIREALVFEVEMVAINGPE